MGTVSATETRVASSVETVDELSGTGQGATVLRGVDVSEMKTGDLAFVRQLYGYFQLDTESTVSADGITTLLADSARLSATPGKGRWGRLDWTPSNSAWLVQDAVFIDDEVGSDTADGLTDTTPVRTFAEVQRRMGDWTTLQPVSGTLTIKILSDSLGGAAGPEHDPITFRNFVGHGANVFIVGTDQVLVENAVANTVVTKNRTTNTPWKITVSAFSANTWTNYIAKGIVFTSGAAAGARCFVARDMAAKTGHVTEFGLDIGGFSIPSDPPANGDMFNIVDYTQVVFGNMVVGWSPEQNSPNGDGGLVIQRCRIVNSSSHSYTAAFPTILGFPETVSALQDCIIATNIEVPTGISNAAGAFNCCCTRNIHILPASFLLWGFGLLRTTQGTNSIGMEPNSQLLLDGDPTFVGPPPNGFGFGVSGLTNSGGTVISGPFSFWDQTAPLVTECLNVLYGGTFIFSGFSPFFGENDYVPIWGTGNATQKIGLGPDGNINMYQISSDGTPPPLPTVVFNANPIKFNGDVQQGSAIESDAFSWDPAAGTYTGPVAFTWAGLNVAQPGGYLFDTYINGGGDTENISTAINPAMKSVFMREASHT